MCFIDHKAWLRMSSSKADEIWNIICRNWTIYLKYEDANAVTYSDTLAGRPEIFSCIFISSPHCFNGVIEWDISYQSCLRTVGSTVNTVFLAEVYTVSTIHNFHISTYPWFHQIRKWYKVRTFFITMTLCLFTWQNQRMEFIFRQDFFQILISYLAHYANNLEPSSNLIDILYIVLCTSAVFYIHLVNVIGLFAENYHKLGYDLCIPVQS